MYEVSIKTTSTTQPQINGYRKTLFAAFDAEDPYKLVTADSLFELFEKIEAANLLFLDSPSVFIRHVDLERREREFPL
jgi:hypothetical protein